MYFSVASDNELLHMRVRSTLRDDVPKHLIIDSCNLKLNESVGQGMYFSYYDYISTHSYTILYSYIYSAVYCLMFHFKNMGLLLLYSYSG